MIDKTVNILGTECKLTLDRKCENCRYCEHEDISDGYVCVNDESEYWADWVEPKHCCAEWVEKNED